MSDFEQQQQHTSVVPPAEGQQYAADNTTQGGPPPLDTYSPWAWVKTAKGILRIVEWLFAIIIFGTMADVTNFDKESSFQFEVAVGVLIFLYTMALIASYIFQKSVERFCLYQPVIELAFDGIFCVLLLAAGAAAAAKCNQRINPCEIFGLDCSATLCDGSGKDVNNVKASIVFTFFTLLLFIASTFFSYRENAAEERKR